MIRLDRADPRYPRALLDLGSPPDPVWVEGDATLLGRGAISIVGTRRMSPYGARIARELASTAAQLGVKQSEYITMSYAQMFTAWREKTGSKVRDMTWAAIGT